jgi:hypothetical protein
MTERNLAIHFKAFVKEDYAMLRRVIVNWNKFANIKATYILGEYNKEELQALENLLAPLKDKINLEIISIFNPYKEGVKRVTHQIREFWKMTKESFISAFDDMLVIKSLTDSDFNKEYKIIRKDYRKLPNDEKGWFIEKQIDGIEWLLKNHNPNKLETLPLLEHHYLPIFDKEIMDFLEANPETLNFIQDSILIHYQLCVKGKKLEDIFKPNLIGTTYKKNKWQIDKNLLSTYKCLNITLPMDNKSKKILKQYSSLKL